MFSPKWGVTIAFMNKLQNLAVEKKVVLSVFAPLLFSLWGSLLVGENLSGWAVNGVPLLLLGGSSFLLIMLLYGKSGLGIKGGRPMMSGFGFAFLGWVCYLLARFVCIGIGDLGSGLGKTYLYLLFLEAICVQLWAFGLVFRAVSEWKSPVSGSVLSGLAFGIVAHWLFQETPSMTSAAIFCLVWGLFYGIIRVRTGSWIGIAIVQSLQSITVWHIVQPTEPSSFTWLYILVGIAYLFFTWRLLPKYKSDLRM